MSNELVVDSLKSVSAYEIIIWAGVLIAAGFGIFKFFSYIFSLFKIIKSKTDRYYGILETVKIHSEQIENLTKSDQTVYSKIEEVNSKVDRLASAIENMQELQNSQERARLKDRIRVIYQDHHEKQEITSVELETLEDLIKSYEDAGGTNSFVHSMIQPEIYTWKLIQ